MPEKRGQYQCTACGLIAEVGWEGEPRNPPTCCEGATMRVVNSDPPFTAAQREQWNATSAWLAERGLLKSKRDYFRFEPKVPLYDKDL